MKRRLFFIACLLFGLTKINSQSLINTRSEYMLYAEFGNLSVFNLNSNEVPYLFNVISGTFKSLSYSVNFRVEDELLSDQTYVLLKDISFLDLKFAYTLGKVQLYFFVENLLGLNNNNNFTIEPNLERLLGIADNVYFTHEESFLIGTSITYNF